MKNIHDMELSPRTRTRCTSTRIAGAQTRFLPFNRGSHPGEVRCGAGNPQHPSGYRTGYFWEEVLERERFLNVLGHFMFVERKDEKVDDGKGGARRIARETLIFPHYHQLDAVRKLVAAAREEGAGRSYLIQHSAGSGKTNSISWLSHRLASLHDREDRKVFDCVVVVTDRRVLDRQLQDAIYQIEHAQGVVKAIDRDSRQLAAALIDGTRIVVTTLQKFPFVLRGLLHAAGAESQEIATADETARAHEAGDRGRLHPRRAGELHHLCRLLRPAQERRGRPAAAQEEGRAGAGEVREPASAQRRAEDRGDRRALPPQRDAPDRRTRQGDGGHPFAAACGALQALLRTLPGRERLYGRSPAGRVQRHGARPRHRHRIHGARQTGTS